jgi:hypothetical protein
MLLLVLTSYSRLAHGQDLARDVSFSWEPIDGAVGYDLQFSREEGDKYIPIEPIEKTDAAEWKGRLTPGSYTFKIRARDQRGVPGRWSEASPIVIKTFAVKITEPAEGLEIQSKQATTHKVKVAWDAASGASLYKLEVLSPSGAVVSKSEAKTSKTTLELPVAAAYKVFVQPIMGDGTEGEKMKMPRSFKIIGKAISKPAASYKQSEFEDEARWSKPDYTDNFKVIISYAKMPPGAEKRKSKRPPQNLEWEKLLENPRYEDTSFSVKGKPFGFYRFEIIAQGALRLPSKALVVQYEYRDESVEPKVKERPRQQYSGALTYTYLPSFQRFTLSSGELQTKLNILMLNSHHISASYWILGNHVGLDIGGQRVYSELFGSRSRVSGPEGQEAIELVYWNFDLSLKARYEMGWLGVEAIGGAIRRTLYSFTQTPANTVAAESGSTQEYVFGGRLYVKAGDMTTGIYGLRGSLVSAKDFAIQDSVHDEYGLDITQPVLTDRLLLTYGFAADISTYMFTTTDSEALQIMKLTLGRFSVGIGYQY